LTRFVHSDFIEVLYSIGTPFIDGQGLGAEAKNKAEDLPVETKVKAKDFKNS